MEVREGRDTLGEICLPGSDASPLGDVIIFPYVPIFSSANTVDVFLACSAYFGNFRHRFHTQLARVIGVFSPTCPVYKVGKEFLNRL